VFGVDMLLDNRDRYGFYTVGPRKTYSKLEAIEYSAESKLPVEWHYNQDAYQAINWTQEPPGSLDFWYEQRARQIRDQYDYIVLWFSGGADSHNILQTFVRNNIFIDEIAQYTNMSAAHDDKDTFFHEELAQTSIPITQQLIGNNPIYKNTQHRLVDITDMEIKLLKDNETRWDHFYRVNSYFSPVTLTRYQLRQQVADYANMIDQGKKLCFVWGIEKPEITQQGKSWFVNFKDGLDHGVSAYAQMLNRPGEYDEYFYWGADFPMLPCKQAHVIKNYCKKFDPAHCDGKHVVEGKFLRSPHLSLHDTAGLPAVFFTYNNKTYTLTMAGMHRLIYQDWMPDAVVAKKVFSTTWPQRDEWLWQGTAPDLGQNYYARGFVWLRNHMKKIAPEHWKEIGGTKLLNGGFHALYNSYRIG
jgi:hypothetical protein